jgi:hypothetical protein
MAPLPSPPPPRSNGKRGSAGFFLPAGVERTHVSFIENTDTTQSVGAGQGKQLTTVDHGVLLGRREVVMIDVLHVTHPCMSGDWCVGTASFQA